jgi:hypothetical protein
MKKNRRKEKRYIEFRSLRWRVPNAEWGDYLRRGLIVLVSKRVARLRMGVEIVWENDRYLLRDLTRNIEVSIPSSWRLVDEAAIYDRRRPRLSTEEMRLGIQEDYCRSFEAWEAA